MSQLSEVQTVTRHEPQLVRLLDEITRVCYALSGLLLLLIGIVYLKEIVMRYAFNSPSVWSIDVISYTLVAMVAMAAPELARTNTHISITLVNDSIKNHRTRDKYMRLLTLVSALVIFYVVYVTGGETYKLFQRDIFTVGTLIIPKWWVAVFIPIGLTLTALQYLRLTIYGLGSSPEQQALKEGQ